ncbi:MAG: hypothetical protein COB98_09895, partial [Flavobacteriaceae bacterium]
LNIGLCYNNHEGSSAEIIRNKNRFFINLHGINGYSLVEITIKNKKLSFKFENKIYLFEKVLDDFPYGADSGLGIQYITNKILLGGKKFSCVDISSNIIFNETGLVENFKYFENYNIATDFVTDPEPRDWISLKNASEEVFFHYKFIGEKLLLYEYDEIKEDFELQYTLLMEPHTAPQSINN